jgi:biopolymer transport protein ExbB/TolQ
MDWTIYIKDIMHLVAQALLPVVMIVLVGLLIYAIFSVGSLIVEFITERRHFKVTIPDFINDINDASLDAVADVINTSGLLKDQKIVLLSVVKNLSLPKEDLFALAKAELGTASSRYDKIVKRNVAITRLAPSFGLLATLIPLGPGIVAMGQGETDILSSSLLIAFDGTAIGLVVGVIFLPIANMRERWFGDYMLALETGMRCLLQKAEIEVEAGVLVPPRKVSRHVKAAEARAVGVETRGQFPADAKGE